MDEVHRVHENTKKKNRDGGMDVCVCARVRACVRKSCKGISGMRTEDMKIYKR